MTIRPSLSTEGSGRSTLVSLINDDQHVRLKNLKPFLEYMTHFYDSQSR